MYVMYLLKCFLVLTNLSQPMFETRKLHSKCKRNSICTIESVLQLWCHMSNTTCIAQKILEGDSLKWQRWRWLDRWIFSKQILDYWYSTVWLLLYQSEPTFYSMTCWISKYFNFMKFLSFRIFLTFMLLFIGSPP